MDEGGQRDFERAGLEVHVHGRSFVDPVKQLIGERLRASRTHEIFERSIHGDVKKSTWVWGDSYYAAVRELTLT